MPTDAQINDLVTTTLNQLGRGRFYQIAQELQRYELMGFILRANGTKLTSGKGKGKLDVRVIDNGIGVQETLMTSIGGSSRWVDLFEEDVYNFTDVLAKMTVPWTQLVDHMTFERRMVIKNKGESRINNVIKPQRMAMMLRVAKTLEDAFFEAPQSGNSKVMFGLKYWIVQNASTGFNGGLPSGFSTVGNINITDNPTFKNYTFTYAAVSKADLVAKLRTAHRKTDWTSPITMAQFRGDTGNRRVVYVNESTINNIELVGEGQNENLGRDIASMDNQIVFKRHPIRWIPKLDSDTNNPVYMLDKGTIFPFVLKGDYLRFGDAHKAPHQHNVIVSDVDLSINTICVNRRSNAVGYVV